MSATECPRCGTAPTMRAKQSHRCHRCGARMGATGIEEVEVKVRAYLYPAGRAWVGRDVAARFRPPS